MKEQETTKEKPEKEVNEQKKEENNKLINLYPPLPAIQVDKDTNYPKDINKSNIIEENNYIISKYEYSGLIQIMNCYELLSQNDSYLKGEFNGSEIKKKL